MIPADIDNAQFGTKLRGYDPDAVDNLLDGVVASWIADRTVSEERAKSLDRLQRQLTEVQRTLDAYGGEPTQVMPSFAVDATKILEAAQRTAEDIVNEARMSAQKIVDDASSEAGAVIDVARNDAAAAMATAMGSVNSWQARVTELQAQEMKLREFVTGALEAVKERLEA